MADVARRLHVRARSRAVRSTKDLSRGPSEGWNSLFPPMPDDLFLARRRMKEGGGPGLNSPPVNGGGWSNAFVRSLRGVAERLN